ncbi:protein RALF-like 32 [Chenopodium quinoa]|uniref:protein RALF-like 32 n=1 Tax=Chenopodium quinoa TaxID=63459 RepID=UPI000B7743C6|nr:protein RALF-like 32 [Chenopodium quinoa]
MEYKAMRKLTCCLFFIFISLPLHVHGARTDTDAYLQCNGSIGECQQENEMLMMSEIARRILEERKYISYGALNRNQPACGGPRGQAYSSNSECLGPAANPYHRGCSKYYRCRSDT